MDRQVVGSTPLVIHARPSLTTYGAQSGLGLGRPGLGRSARQLAGHLGRRLAAVRGLGRMRSTGLTASSVSRGRGTVCSPGKPAQGTDVAFAGHMHERISGGGRPARQADQAGGSTDIAPRRSDRRTSWGRPIGGATSAVYGGGPPRPSASKRLSAGESPRSPRSPAASPSAAWTADRSGRRGRRVTYAGDGRQAAEARDRGTVTLTEALLRNEVAAMVTRDGIAATPYFQLSPPEEQARLLAVAEECERRARLRGEGGTP